MPRRTTIFIVDGSIFKTKSVISLRSLLPKLNDWNVITFPPIDHTQALARMEACVQDVKVWLCDNGLVMNDNKSQAIVIRSSSLRTPTSLTRVNICGQLVDTSPVIRDLGFTIDTNLTMTSQVANVCRSATICRKLQIYETRLAPLYVRVSYTDW